MRVYRCVCVCRRVYYIEACGGCGARRGGVTPSDHAGQRALSHRLGACYVVNVALRLCGQERGLACPSRSLLHHRTCVMATPKCLTYATFCHTPKKYTTFI